MCCHPPGAPLNKRNGRLNNLSTNKTCPGGPHASEHLDWVATHAAANVTLGFSWKPELGSDEPE